MFASIILKMCKTGAVKTRKVKDVAGNENKKILCEKMFWKLHEMLMAAD